MLILAQPAVVSRRSVTWQQMIKGALPVATETARDAQVLKPCPLPVSFNQTLTVTCPVACRTESREG